jgi:hypothetical protein
MRCPTVQKSDAVDSVPDAEQVTPAACWTVTFSVYDKIEAPTADWNRCASQSRGRRRRHQNRF